MNPASCETLHHKQQLYREQKDSGLPHDAICPVVDGHSSQQWVVMVDGQLLQVTVEGQPSDYSQKLAYGHMLLAKTVTMHR